MAQAKDIVIVPCYFRAEFLFLCLEHLASADGIDTKQVWLIHDRKYGDLLQFEQDLIDVGRVIEHWKPHFRDLRMAMRLEHGSYGNSRNILSAYAAAFETDAEFVYLVEDDVLVTSDFFNWHEHIQSTNPFCSIAGTCDRNKVPLAGESFESSEYASLGVCWRRENLEAVVQHATEDYFSNPTPYILKHFPLSRHGLWAMEQDGLIQRVMEQRFEKAVFATQPRAFHIGVFGYHRGIGKINMATGPLSERIEFYRKALADSEWVSRVAGMQTDVQVYR